MSLILYPDPAADSFVSVVEADGYIALYTLNSAEWIALPVDTKEQLMRIAYRDIIDHTDPTTYPTPLPVCVGEAQALMASHDNINSISSGVASTTVSGALRSQKVGSLEQSFYDTKTTSASRTLSRIPSIAYKCLLDLGYSFKSKTTGLKQTLLGRS